MRILFTGASSFTGYWFVRELVAEGHDVCAVFQKKSVADYGGIRRRRIDLLPSSIDSVWNCSFGDDRFLEVVEASDWDFICHHGADVRNYRSPVFDIHRALEANTHRVVEVLDRLTSNSRFVLTGSVFEPGEGAGSEGLPSFSPYGLSKSLTSRVFETYAADAQVGLGKFVIPNPFGPYEEARFTAYLMRTWRGGGRASVKTPAYVRDNVHVSLLAKAYCMFLDHVPEKGSSRLYPSGYVESQGQFALRLAGAVSERLGWACELDLAVQSEFMEPRIRINTDPAEALVADWSEAAAWDEFADYYASTK